MLVSLTSSFAIDTLQTGHEHEETDIRTEIKEHIDHHLKDVHSFHLFSDDETGAHYGFPLPVILWDNGLTTFMSSKFHHGEDLVPYGEDEQLMLFHGKIYAVKDMVYLTEKKEREVQNEEGEMETESYYDTVSTVPVEQFRNDYIMGHKEMEETVHVANRKPLDLSITKNVFSIFFISLIIIWMFRSAAKGYKNSLVPSGAAKFLEPVVIFIRDEIAIPNIGEKDYKRFMSYLLTIFFFIWIVNLFGLTPLGINVTGNIAITFALAFMTFLITQFTGRKEYWKHIFWMPGVPVPMKIILMPIEILGVFIKPFALLIRLYANITAGHVVLMSIIGLMFIFQNWVGSSLSFVLAFALSLLELLVAALQAYIFTMLTALYFGSAVAEHDDH